jgi:hypothetical protein
MRFSMRFSMNADCATEHALRLTITENHGPATRWPTMYVVVLLYKDQE